MSRFGKVLGKGCLPCNGRFRAAELLCLFTVAPEKSPVLSSGDKLARFDGMRRAHADPRPIMICRAALSMPPSLMCLPLLRRFIVLVAEVRPAAAGPSTVLRGLNHDESPLPGLPPYFTLGKAFLT